MSDSEYVKSEVKDAITREGPEKGSHVEFNFFSTRRCLKSVFTNF